MGPIRGSKKKKKTDRRSEENGSGSGSGSGSAEKECPLDWWGELSKRINGIQSPSKSLEKFEHTFRMTQKTFNHICSLVKEDMVVKSRDFTFLNGNVLSLPDLVSVALRRLGSGDSLVTVADFFGLNHSTVSQVTWRFVESMETRGLDHLKWPSNESKLAQIKSKFQKLQGLPNCCGAIDTTHIMMLLPSSDPASNVWLDQQKNHSMVLQAIVDPDMRFLDIVTGWPGKMKDSELFQTSNFYKMCERGERLNGNKLQLGEGSEIREYIIGDSGFPLLPYLVVPYNGKEVSGAEAEFNKRLLETRVVAKRALGRLKEMWRIIQGVMWRPDKHRLPRIILVCCMLHNIIIDMEDEAQGNIPVCEEHDVEYEQQVCESVDMEGVLLRDKLALYLSGRLPP